MTPTVAEFLSPGFPLVCPAISKRAFDCKPVSLPFIVGMRKMPTKHLTSPLIFHRRWTTSPPPRCLACWCGLHVPNYCITLYFCPSVDLGINFLMSANSVPTSPYFLLYSKVRDIKMGRQSPLSRPPKQMILIKSPPRPAPRRRPPAQET